MNVSFIFGMKTNCSKDCGFSDVVRTTERGYIVHENQVEKKVIGGVGSKNIQKEIRTEMAVFEKQGVKGPNLSKCYKYLKSIPPTSVESERCFLARW
jgi:hypothetical protein